jgi:hypothetical protein
MYPEAFGSLTSAFTQLGFIVTTLLLFNTYQDNLSMGKVFYAFLCISLCSLAFVHVLFLVPVLWLMMYTQLQSFSLRTFFASIIGLITPYWFLSLWFIYVQDFSLLGQHFAALGVFEPIDYMEASLEQVLVSSFLLILSIASIIHFWHNSYEDKMHIRMLYGFFTLMTLLLMLFIALQPQHFDILIGKQASIDVRKCRQDRVIITKIRITVFWLLIQGSEQIAQTFSHVPCGELCHVVVEHHMLAKDSRILRVKAENKTYTELIQTF